MNDPAHELLEPAWQMRWRVPELALMLSDRTVAQARRAGDTALRLRAESLALFASNRLGRGVAATERAIAALRDAEDDRESQSAAELRVELASCARGSGSHDVALRVLQPVLEQERIRPDLRAHALLELAASLPARRRIGERVEALDEAERLYTAEAGLSRDTTRLLRARVSTARAGHHRRHAECTAAAEAAEAGLALLERLGDPTADSGEIHAHLVLERVQALLDLGAHSAAVRVAAPVLWQPLRAAAAGPAGWLRFALATRVHAPNGEHRTAVRLLTEALAGAERHELGNLQAEVLGTLSHLHERSQNLAEALRCLRGAYAADRRWRASVHTARVRLLEEFPATAGPVAVPRQPTAENAGARQQQEQVVPRHRTGDEDARHSARRLTDTPVGEDDAESEGTDTQTMPEPPLLARTNHRWVQSDSAEQSPEEVPPEEMPPGPRHADAVQAAVQQSRVTETENSPASAAEAPLAPEMLPGLAQEIRKAGQREPVGAEPALPDQPLADRSLADQWSFPTLGEPPSETSTSGPAGPRTPSPEAVGAKSPTPDVTTIMPVIPGPPDPEPEPFGRPEAGTEQAGRQRPDEPWRDEPVSPDPAAVMPGPDPLAYEHAAPEHAERDVSASTVNGVSPDDPPWLRTAVGADEGPTGRRSQGGRSLAEIRAALRLVEDRSDDRRAQQPSGPTPTAEAAQDPSVSGAVPEQTSGRRHRHAEPDEAGPRRDRPDEHSAEEFLAKHRDLLQGLPPIQVAKQEAEPSSEVGLADLLAEALVAYESGKRSQPQVADEEPFSASHHTAHVPGVTDRADSRMQHSSRTGEDTDGSGMRARHRHAASENPDSWTPGR